MSKTLQVAIDLGCETVKVSYAYVDNSGKVKHGKLEVTDHPYPGTVSYCRETASWLIGEGIEQQSGFTYDTIIRIKDLISMLIPTTNSHGEPVDNSEFYSGHKEFRRFYFPQKVKASSSMAKAVDNGQTFSSSITPRELCRQFFVKLFGDCITKPVKDIIKANPHLDGVCFTSVYPAKANKEYTDELIDLTKYAVTKSSFTGKITYDKLSSPKAIAVGAYYNKLISDDSATLIVNIGERDTSVSKVYIFNEDNKVSINIDGRAGHNLPTEIGGEDFDEALSNLIDDKINLREVLGIGSGHTSEQGTYRQQYLLMREIKTVKECLSVSDVDYKKVFPTGVPIHVHRDVIIETNVSRDEFVSKMLKGAGSVGSELSDYLKLEFRRPTNKNVKTVLFTGGGAATHFLCDYLKNDIGAMAKNVKFKVASSGTGANAVDSTYAAAFGAAIMAPAGIVLYLRTAMTYGTWAKERLHPGDASPTKVFSVIIDAGTIIPEEGYEKTILFSTGQSEIKSDEILAYPEKLGGKKLPVGDPGSTVRRDLEKKGLRVLSGDDGKGLIYFVKKGIGGESRFFKPTSVPKIYIDEGLRVDYDGHVELVVRTNKDRNSAYKELHNVEAVASGMPDFDMINDY